MGELLESGSEISELGENSNSGKNERRQGENQLKENDGNCDDQQQAIELEQAKQEITGNSENSLH